MASRDLTALRSRFPALARQQEGRPCVFADSPGGSQVPDTVIEAIAGYLRRSNSNTHGAFATSAETDALVEEAHRAGADLVGGHANEIVFGQNATSLLLHVSRSFARTLGPGDEVVVTRLDHDANVRPWMLAAEDAGVAVRWADVVEEDVTLDLDSLDAALSERTKLVAVTMASNAVGSITPAAEIARRAHDAGALVCFDAVHIAQHRSLDVRALDADLLVCSPYKVFGPHLGLLWARHEVLEEWRPYKLRANTDELPYRWETGTMNHEAYAGFVATLDYLSEIGHSFGGASAHASRRDAVVAAFQAIRSYETGLATSFLEGARGLEDVRLFGIADPMRVDERTPTFALRVADKAPAVSSERLGERGILTWDGHYFALELMERLGLEPGLGGALRIGFCHYNTAQEVDRVLAELAQLAALADRPAQTEESAPADH